MCLPLQLDQLLYLIKRKFSKYTHQNSSTAAACQVASSCLTLCDPMDCSPPGSSVHGILQARILGWVSFPRGSSRPRGWTHDSYWHWNMSLHWQADSWPLVPPGKPVLQLGWLIITGNYFEPWHFSSQNVLSMQNFTLSSVFSSGKSHK